MTDRHIEFIVRGVLIHNARLLVCTNLKRGYHYLPGGHVEFGESAHDALAREFVEETGLKLAVGRLLLAAEERFHDGDRQRHELNLVFHVEHLGQLPSVQSLESAIGFEWLSADSLRNADFRPAAIKAWLLSWGLKTPPSGTDWRSSP
jgi:8-oxo-dGTP diphosphatase